MVTKKWSLKDKDKWLNQWKAKGYLLKTVEWLGGNKDSCSLTWSRPAGTEVNSRKVPAALREKEPLKTTNEKLAWEGFDVTKLINWNRALDLADKTKDQSTEAFLSKEMEDI